MFFWFCSCVLRYVKKNLNPFFLSSSSVHLQSTNVKLKIYYLLVFTDKFDIWYIILELDFLDFIDTRLVVLNNLAFSRY